MIATPHGDTAPLTSFLERHLAAPARDLRLVRRTLRGGLVSASVQHVSARYADDNGVNRNTRFVVKHLDGSAVREALVYENLLPHRLGLAPALFAVSREPDATLLFLEPVASKPRWPWRDITLAARVLEKLAALHQMAHEAGAFGDWDYGDELEYEAESTLRHAEAFALATKDPMVRAGLPALRRLAGNISAVRRGLLELDVLPPTVIHGDVHPGNVVVRTRGKQSEPLLLDWARARLGSPLEDVNSWIEWLGFWEDGVRSKHDTLLGGYLRARGLAAPASRVLRDAYWTAGALNSCSGALSHHLIVAGDPANGLQQRATALRAVHHCVRMIRRADRARVQSGAASSDGASAVAGD